MPKKLNEDALRAQILALRAEMPPVSYRDICARLRVSQPFVSRVIKGAKTAPPAAEAPAETPPMKGERFELDEPDPPRSAPPTDKKSAPKPDAEPTNDTANQEARVRDIYL